MANEWVRGAVSLIPNVAPNHTITNAINAIQSVLTQSGWELASWTPGGDDRYFVRVDRATQDKWRYEGDGPVQNCGIHVFSANSNTEIRLSPFLENTALNAAQVDSKDATATTNRRGYVTINWDVTAPNNYLMIGGDDGFYIEAGRDASPTNLGHGAVVTVGEITELNATKSLQRRWTAQGFAMDLFSECRFTGNRNNRFVTNDGTSRNFSSHLALYGVRGVASTTSSPSPSNFVDYFIGNRDLILGQTAQGTGNSDFRYACTFGQINSPEDARYRICPILLLQENNTSDITNRAAISTSTSNTIAVATGGANVSFRDVRHDRRIAKFVIVDYTLIPFANLTEAQTGQVYRVLEFNDNGRTANLGVEWPVTVVTPSLI